MSAQHPTRSRALLALGVSSAFVLAAALGGLPSAPARAQESSADTTRVAPWTGGDHLSLAVAADTEYVRGADAKVVITGPKDIVDHIVVERDLIRYDDELRKWRPWPWRDEGHVRIVVTAPSLSSAAMRGSGRLDLGRLSQDSFDLTLSGSGVARAKGAVKRLQVRIFGSGGAKVDDLKADQLDARSAGSGWLEVSGSSDSLRLMLTGSGRADLGGLKVGDATVMLTGSGSARLAPKTSAVLTLTGSGSVRLLSEPARLQVRGHGSARVIHPNES